MVHLAMKALMINTQNASSKLYPLKLLCNVLNFKFRLKITSNLENTEKKNFK